MEKIINFRLEDFEGPLDLLLALVQKNKMSLYDIEIVTLIDQYLAIVGTPEGNADVLDSASEFISMAARLVQMKSAMLLPRSEEAERMREELTGLLVEYSACKAVATQLKQMADGVFVVARRPMVVKLDSAYRGSHAVSELASAFTGLMGRSAARRMPRAEQFDEIVTAPIVSVTGRVIYLLRGLTNGAITRLRQAFGACRSRGETVATFLALLELIRGGRVQIKDDEALCIPAGARRRVARQTGSKEEGPLWN